MTAKFKTDSTKPITTEYNPLEVEQEIRLFWQQNQTRQKLEDHRLNHNKGTLGYVEGPPTLNGIPHVGHARGRTMKDLRYRYKTMQGYYIPFWAGWDCQGLPVELEVERQLGVKNKRELLQRVGMEKFIAECKKAIMKYHEMWTEVDYKLGVFMNHDKAYWTYHDSYIEREWQILKQAWNQELLEEGHYVVAYCPGCQTSLSSAEVGYEDSYKIVEDPSLYFKFKRANSKDEYFLVWTTMPFTLVTDMLLAVHPTAEYAKVKINEETWIMARTRVEPVMQELKIEKYEVTERLAGKDLEGIRYEYPFKALVPKQAQLEAEHKLVHTVVLEDFVDIETATGVVHQSPGNGEEDFWAAQKRGVPVFAPFDDEVKFTEEAGEFNGLFARDADKKVIEELRKRGLLVETKTIKHEYPTCWRSHHKLIWLARKEYFLRTDRINQKVLEAAEKTEFYYESPENRFVTFLKEGKPWCISRERVWGAPLPVWKCEKCGSKTLIASKQELLERANEKVPADFELHKPWVDRLTLKCKECGGIMRREDFVLDTWHDSGASFYARFTDEEYKAYVPVDFLTEGIDQTRGWANSLLLEYVILSGKAESPYHAFLFQGLAQDAKGQKMSKSLGNFLEAGKLLENSSADVVRFYLLRKCSPVDFISFDLKELGRRSYQVLSTLYHLSRFLLQNAEFDGFVPSEHTLEWAKAKRQLKSPDLWLLSELQEAIEGYTAALERCEFNFALAVLEDHVIEIVSRLYVPMVRRDLWSDSPETLDRRLAVYAVLWNALKTLTLLFNPVTPYLSEALYQKVYRKLDDSLFESVNFEEWPQPNPDLRDEKLEQQFKTLFNTVSLAFAARQSAKVKRRWPLSRMIVVVPDAVLAGLKETEELLLELSNVKTAELLKEVPDYVSAEGWVSAVEGDVKVFLDTHRDEELLGEGLMRDLSRRVQALRKELGYMPTDVLEIVHVAGLDDETTRLLRPFVGRMEELVRTKRIQLYASAEDIGVEWHGNNMDDKKVDIAIPKPEQKR
ncbi:MAG TPA: isoleucine--tRNA ligase [Candidatus Eisenbacteria bacterium]|nr:isoleucine--tRNA ligase [Candidatus Eisenbacteria bacterium]